MLQNKTLKTGSSVIIALIIIVIAIFLLDHYSITFNDILAAIKNFFNLN